MREMSRFTPSQSPSPERMPPRPVMVPPVAVRTSIQIISSCIQMLRVNIPSAPSLLRTRVLSPRLRIIMETPVMAAAVPRRRISRK